MRSSSSFGAMPNDPKGCREEAEHCRRIARLAPPPLAHELEELARFWLKLAADLERFQFKRRRKLH